MSQVRWVEFEFEISKGFPGDWSPFKLLPWWSIVSWKRSHESNPSTARVWMLRHNRAHWVRGLDYGDGYCSWRICHTPCGVICMEISWGQTPSEPECTPQWVWQNWILPWAWFLTSMLHMLFCPIPSFWNILDIFHALYSINYTTPVKWNRHMYHVFSEHTSHILLISNNSS